MAEQKLSTPKEIQSSLGKFWTASNILSLSRLVLTVPAAYLILTRPTPDPLVIILVIVAIATDWFDGRIARWSKTVSTWGKVLDPTADKIGGGLVILAMVGAGLLPTWLVVLYIVRDAVIFFLWQYMTRRTNHVYMSLWPGKLTVGLLALTVILILLGVDEGPRQFLILASGGFMMYSLIHYLVLFFIELRTLAKKGHGRIQAKQNDELEQVQPSRPASDAQ